MLEDHPSPAPRIIAAEAVIVAAAFAALYLLTLAGTHNEGGDGIGYMTQIRSGDAALIFNPYHLAYNWLGWAAYHIARLAGFGGGPLGPVQIMNATLGAAGVGVLWALMRAAAPGRTAAVAAVGLLGLSFGYWGYAVDAELYTLDAFLLILLLAAAWRAATIRSPRTFAVMGLANGAAVLGHNTAALWLLVAIMLLARARRDLPRAVLLRAAAAYAAGAAAVVLPAYALAVPAVGLHTPREYYDWLTGYAQSGSYGHWQTTTPLRVALGAGRALVGAHSALALSPVHRFIAQHFADKSLRKEFFLVRNVSSGEAYALLAVAAVVGLALLALAAHWLRRPALAPRTRALALVALVWLVPYVIFFAWWQPENVKFWISSWIPAAVLLALPLSSADLGPRVRRLAPYALAVAMSALFVVNLAGSILPYRAKSNDYWRVRVAWYEQNTHPGDIVFANDYVYVEYLNYFGHGKAYDLGNDIIGKVGPERAPAEIQRLIDASPGSRVFFSSEIFYPGQDQYSNCVEPICTTGDAVRRAFQPRSTEVADLPLEEVWQLRR
ncbi:MAG TPA: hypothetical protein VEZ14_13520 [Dehalococcoidia bacterium]|nr:hypothetical protein [Dehalococcoidia bacterium]